MLQTNLNQTKAIHKNRTNNLNKQIKVMDPNIMAKSFQILKKNKIFQINSQNHNLRHKIKINHLNNQIKTHRRKIRYKILSNHNLKNHNKICNKKNKVI